MATLSTTLSIADRIERFEKSEIYESSIEQPIIRALLFTLCSINWEGNSHVIHDLFEKRHSDEETYKHALTKLGYNTEEVYLSAEETATLEINQPAFVCINHQNYLLVSISKGKALIYDYINDLDTEKDLSNTPIKLVQVTEFSTIFRNAENLGGAKPEWTKFAISPYRSTLRKVFLISFVINVLSALNPFFIMSVYNFAIPASSQSTLYWIVLGALIVVGLENFFKLERNAIFQESGEELARFVSETVVSKLVWIPYSKSSGANEASQLARLKDIDQLRKTFSAESTQNYFDLPFFVVFLAGLVILGGSAAIIIVVGLILFILYGIVAKANYSLAATQSSQASAKVQSQWHDTLSNLDSIQGLPLEHVANVKLTSAYRQSSSDGALMSRLNQKIMRNGQSISQVIGTVCIFYTAYMVMEGELDFGAMLAIIMLIWKCLTPFIGIYNSVTKLSQVKKSANQIDALMMIDDDRRGISDTTPIIETSGNLQFNEVGLRHPVSNFTLKQISFKVMPGEIFVITGLSGSGKSTILDIIAKLAENYQGGVTVDNMNIKQFNAFTYRELIRYKSDALEFFDTSLSDNFYLYTGYHNDNFLNLFIDYFSLHDYLSEGPQTILNYQNTQHFPSYVKELLDILLCLGSNNKGFILIDNVLVGKDEKTIKQFMRFLEDYYDEASIILVSNDPIILAKANNILLMDADGSQKFCGAPDKVLDQYENLLNSEL